MNKPLFAFYDRKATLQLLLRAHIHLDQPRPRRQIRWQDLLQRRIQPLLYEITL